MNSPKRILGPVCLSLLLAAVGVHAGEISMDVRGLAVATAAPASDDAAAPASQSITDVGNNEMPASQPRRWRMTSPGTTNPELADDAGSVADAPAAAAASSGNAAPAPMKPRNRWQSLVPGAIK